MHTRRIHQLLRIGGATLTSYKVIRFKLVPLQCIKAVNFSLVYKCINACSKYVVTVHVNTYFYYNKLMKVY